MTEDVYRAGGFPAVLYLHMAPEWERRGHDRDELANLLLAEWPKRGHVLGGPEYDKWKRKFLRSVHGRLQ